MEIYADLHNHTTFSDGELSPEDIVSEAKKAGIAAVAVTDHDTDSGVDRAVEAGRRLNVEVVPGIEMSVRFKRPFFTGTLHLLCYFPPRMLEDSNFRREVNQIVSKGRGESLVKERVSQINREFGPCGRTPLLRQDLLFEDISRYSSNATRRHFALALSEIHSVRDNDKMNSIIGNKSPAYVPSGIDLSDVSPIFEHFPVTGVMAHPAAGSFPGKGHYREVLPPVETVEKLLPEFLEAGVEGIEIYYPGHTKEDADLLLLWAERHNLIVTGGSDCHDREERPFGIAGLNRTDFEKFSRFLNSNLHE